MTQIVSSHRISTGLAFMEWVDRLPYFMSDGIFCDLYFKAKTGEYSFVMWVRDIGYIIW